jgi:Zn-dependent peptidase ImmA (M78 family)/DNA-binding XRE family transcriptional regulator
MFTPSRLRLARTRRGLNKIRLAELVGVTSRAITAFEAGEYGPDDATLGKLSQVLHFPAAFFSGSEIHEPSKDAASFRSMTKMSAAHRDSALSAGGLAFLLSDWLDKRFELPEAQVPVLNDEEPATAAQSLRKLWGLGEKPVKNMIHLLEAKGVRIFSLAEDNREVDAFSMWREDTPFVFLNTYKSSEHSRFDAAHELGHLVLHRHGGPHGREAEHQANQFASAFLMPRSSVIAYAPRVAQVNGLVELKKQWIVSVAALAYRLKTLGLVNEWHYRTLAIEISTRGWRTNEPEPAARETSMILPKILESLREEGITKHDIAREIAIEPAELEKLVFGLVLFSIEGKLGSASVSKGRANLKLVQ